MVKITAMTASVVRRNQLTAEGGVIHVTLTGAPAYTYTPTAVTGKTVRVISCYDVDSAYDAVTAAVSNGVITVDSAGGTTTIYSLTFIYE
jgi:hypothetical protein